MIFYNKLVDTKQFESGNLFCPNCNCKFKSNFIGARALADHFVIYKKVPFFVEVKSSKNATSYSLRYIKEHQLSHSIQIEHHGVPYLFAICDRSRPRHFKMYLLHAYVLDVIISKLHPRKSIKWSILSEVAETCDRLPGGLWDIGPALQKIIVDHWLIGRGAY